MAPPTRSASVRHKSHAAVRIVPFRDDTNLVALRYEKTVAAEPPIRIVPRRNNTVSRSSTPAPAPAPAPAAGPALRAPATRPQSPATTSSSSAHSSGRNSPVVVVAPPRSITGIAPPAEQHPALRCPGPTTQIESKRDSGHAPTPISLSPTIHEEDCEDDDFCFSYDRVNALADAAVVSPHAAATPAVQRPVSQNTVLDQDDVSVYSTDHGTVAAATEPNGVGVFAMPAASEASSHNPPLTTSRSLSLEKSMWTTPSSSSASSSSPIAEGTTAAPKPRKLVKSFSLRSLSMLRKESLHVRGEAEAPTFALRRSGALPQPLDRDLDRDLELDLTLRGSALSPSSTTATITPATATATATPAASPTTAVAAAPAPRIKSSLSTTNKPSRFWLRTRSRRHSFTSSSNNGDDEANADFLPLSVPTQPDTFFEDDFISGLSFSKRGSVMLGGHRALALDGIMDQPPPRPSLDDNGDEVFATPLQSPSLATDHLQPDTATNTNEMINETNDTGHVNNSQHTPAEETVESTRLEPPTAAPQIRVMAAESERESFKVRSLYAVGDTINWEDGAPPAEGERQGLGPTLEAPLEEEETTASTPPKLNPSESTPRSGSSLSHRPDGTKKETELAGGLEDWEDVEGANVDRYGFITVPRPTSRLGTPTELKSAQFSPRRRNMLQKRDPAGSSPLAANRGPNRKVSARSLNTQHSNLSTTSLRSTRSVMRQAGNLLPHNRDRRWMDEAGDMLTVAPSLQDIAEEAKVDKISEALKRKEWERAEKWRKMAKNIKKGNHGEGMEFEFDVKNAKLIERTWKGIPDRWRSAAWWSFLEASAKSHKGSASAEEIIAAFHGLQERPSTDDVQIDLDVPRTINRHIMFRKRYRGGQRLLFRVLHALSIYFPETGYVQGMASLAATLLCYFDEEKCFVMLVRMWELRGLDRLYRPGFEGLMAALKEFDDHWLNKDVAEKLTELCIDNTAYGTRWYLTLFNLSIPFPAQLRVWDVFLLLGDAEKHDASTHNNSSKKQPAANGTPAAVAPTGLDVLHATSAALIQALREVLLDSDFENAMKALTAWIPIKDEDMLMKVTKAEWKSRLGKKRS